MGWFSVAVAAAAFAVLMPAAGVKVDESGFEDLLEIIRSVLHAVDKSFILFPGAGLGGETDFKSFCKRLKKHVASSSDLVNFVGRGEKRLQVNSRTPPQE
jgi:hypothetical protein